MDQRHSFLSATLAELTRRKVLRTLGAYAVGVFVLLQLMDAAVDPLRLPDWLPTLIVIALILGFPVVFLLSWHLELTAQGVRRADAAGLLSKRQSATLFGAMLLVTAALGYAFSVYYAGVFEEVVAPGDGTSVAVGRTFSAPQNSIAVLPFADLSAAGDQAWFSDGIAEEILNLLAQVDGLHVAARTSSFAFRDRDQDIREIGRLLNVRTVLEGSVRTAGNRVRLTAQLINVEDGYHIWSKSYDRELDDLFAIQDEVASSIAGSLVESFAGLEHKAAGTTDSVAAANAYRTGRLHWWRRTPAELERAIGFFDEAVKQDPGFAPAYAAMADTWVLLSQYGNLTPVHAIEQAEPMIEKALALDPQSAEAFAALGLARAQIGQQDSAESALRRAIELNEDYIPAQLWLATSLADQGRWPEQRQVLERALELDPLNELLAVNLAYNMSMRGEAGAGRALLKKLVAVRPDSTLLLRSLSDVTFYSGSLFEGWKLAQQAHRLQPEDPVDTAALAKIWMTLGRPDEADRLLTEGLERSGQNANLQSTRWLTLLTDGRYEEAERVTREAMGTDPEQLPDALRRAYGVQLGMLAMARGDWRTARQHLADAAQPGGDALKGGEAMLALTVASLAAQRDGDRAAAANWLDEAGRLHDRAQLNGVDDADFHYSAAVIAALQQRHDVALRELQAAYDRGFRQKWLLDLDWRLDGVRDAPAFVELRARIAEDIQRCLEAIGQFRVAQR